MNQAKTGRMYFHPTLGIPLWYDDCLLDATGAAYWCDSDAVDRVKFIHPDNYTYETTGSGSVLTSTEAEQGLLYQGQSFNKIIVGTSIISIEDDAFSSAAGFLYRNCTIEFSDSLTSIGDRVFKSWKNNRSEIIFGTGLLSIGEEAFYGWQSNNNELEFNDGLLTIGVRSFFDWNSYSKSIIIPNSVTSIGSDAFNTMESCVGEVTIGNGVTSIGDGAFKHFITNNKVLTLGSSLTTIGYKAFYEWKTSNKKITIPSTVTSIGISAFAEWSSSVEPLEFKNGDADLITIGNDAFKNLGSTGHLSPVIVGDGSTVPASELSKWKTKLTPAGEWLSINGVLWADIA